MDWLDWLKVGGVVIILLAILGAYLERKEKRQQELEEAERIRQMKIEKEERRRQKELEEAERQRQKELEEAERQRQEEMKEEKYFADALKKNICPQCGSKGTLQELEDERVQGPYIFKGMITKTYRYTSDQRRMENWQRHFENAVGCTQCDYHKVYSQDYDYNVKEMADDGYNCPKCNEKDSVYLKEVKTADRYQANKEVEEQTAKGTKTRYIKVTKLLEEETYACKHCDFTSVATLTKEL